MRIRHWNHDPKISSSAFVAPTAVLIGRVSVAERCRVMYGAVLDAEGARIEVGACSIINEHAVLRATNEARHFPVLLADHVLVGPHATLLGCEIERCCYVATGVTVLQGAVLRTGAAIGVGALVHAKTVIPEQFFVPPNSIAIGDPVKIYKADDVELIAAIKSVGFAKVAFGVGPEWGDRIRRYEASTEVRSAEFASHFQDEIIEEQSVKADAPPT